MKIAVDGMGGDNAPAAVVEGCVAAVKENDVEIIITGPSETIKSELEKYEYPKEKITIVDAKEVITFNEHPVMAIRRKKDSSLVKAIMLVRNGEADAVLSGGNTGALLVGAKLFLRMIKGINRPALAPVVPGRNGNFMLVDCGANAECKPINLLQFAYMGKIYSENILNIKNPKVGLINIGEEEEKGNELTKETYKLLKKADLNFIGNVEPRDIPAGNTDVLVCDGFVGNTVLKMYEGAASNIFSILKSGIKSSPMYMLGGLMLKPMFKTFKKKFDYTEIGGAAFLGVNGICVKAHGSSNAKAFKNAVKQVIKFYDGKVIDKIRDEIEKESSKSKTEE